MEINLKAYGEEVFLIVSLKTVFEYLHLAKGYYKINLIVFVFSLWENYRWGLTSFGQYIFMVRKVFEPLELYCIYLYSYS